MRTLFAVGRKTPQQKLFRWSVAAGDWVEDAPLLSAERKDLEAAWPVLNLVTATEAECIAWLEERFPQKASQ